MCGVSHEHVCTCVHVCMHSSVEEMPVYGCSGEGLRDSVKLERPQGKCETALLSAGRGCSRDSCAKVLRWVWLLQSPQGLTSWGVSSLDHIYSVTAFVLRGMTLLRGTSKQMLPPKWRPGALCIFKSLYHRQDSRIIIIEHLKPSHQKVF